MTEHTNLRLGRLPQGLQARLARTALGWSLWDVATRCDVSPPRLSEYERGRGGGLNLEQIDRIRGTLSAELARRFPEEE